MVEALPYYAAAFVFGYLCGSIPFGILLTRLAGGPDLRTVGSGNIGATNVLRTGRRGLAAATLIGDMLKGTIAVLVTRQVLGHDSALVAAGGAFLGHLFPVWLGFRGGKGVATYIGVLRHRLACGNRVLRDLARGRGGQPLLVAGGLDRQRGDAGFPVVARRGHRGGGILIAVGGAVDHASRQYRPAAQRHGRQDRRAITERQRLISLRHCVRSLRAGAVQGVAILASVAEVPMARIGRVALAGLGADQAFRAMRKPFELDGGKRVLRQQAREHARQNDDRLFHISPA